MISVLASEADEPVVREFFELFKTPWEFFQTGSRADVLLCTRNEVPASNARLILHYESAATCTQPAPKILVHEGQSLPVYVSGCSVEDSASPVLSEKNVGAQIAVRIAYDLFAEVRHLVSDGQPIEHAATPTLEQHIELLRQLILRHGLPLVEIPARPAGHEFIACLTHDVDHVGIRNHKFDHTLFGFLYRATAGTVLEVARGKKSFGQLAANCWAVAKLPLIHAGLAKDFWYQFNGYAELENGAPSTFFVIPKKGEAGLDPENDECRPNRAASYDARDLTDILRGLERHGKEVAVHGLNAWRDAAAGREEKEIISEIIGASPEPKRAAAPLAGRSDQNSSAGGTRGGTAGNKSCSAVGVRMHWLYFNPQSPVELDKAGFAYDSTCGYNDTVGFRAGTAQVFKPLAAQKLMELPMQIMDTALFYPSYLNLSPKQAEQRISPLIADVARFGGALTVNWHDRSIAPERLWDGTYRWLLEELKNQNAWFATASQAVGWFRKRRGVNFETTAAGELKIRAAHGGGNLPAVRVRIFEPRGGGGFVDRLLRDGEEISLAV